MPSSRRLFKLACFEPLALFLRQLLGGAAVRLELLAFDASLLLGLLRNDETRRKKWVSFASRDPEGKIRGGEGSVVPMLTRKKGGKRRDR